MTDQARRHAAHRWMPRLAAIIAGKKESAAGSCIDCRCINAIWHFAIRHDRICETPTVPAVARRKVSAAIVRDHHTIIVRADVDGFRMRRMHGNRVDLELARGGHHPRVSVSAFLRTPETL